MLTPAWFPLRYHPDQSRLYRTECKFPVVVAARGSGKTETARRFLVRHLPVIKPWPDPKYAYGLPTYNQAKRVVWPQLEALIPKDWLIKNGANRSELSFTTVFGSQLFIVGMDKPARIEGIQLDGAILDECSDIKPGTFTRTIMPMLTHRNGFCWRIGVPKRTGPGAFEFREAFDKGIKGDPDIESYTWSADTVLTPEQLAKAAALLDDKDYDEQMKGIWVSASGAVFHAFDEFVNMSKSAIYNPRLPVGVGCDFNVNPMAWVLFHVIDNVMYVFDEIYLKDTNTPKTLDVLKQRYYNHDAGWHFFGDASSRQRHTSSDMSDYLIILNDLRFLNASGHSHRVSFPRDNPPRRSRFAACNALLKNAAGVSRCFIHPKCKHLRADLEQRTYKEGTTELPTEEGLIGHITDAWGYPVSTLFPIRYEIDDCGQVYAGESKYDL